MIHEELYIILDDVRRKIDIPSPSGITLKFQSNMFNDLSKFCASYSYTFKIPKTQNNIDAFDMIDDMRHASSAYGKKIACEFYRDGVRLFDNAFLYISETEATYSAVMTWNVLSWLLYVNDDDKSIKDMEGEGKTIVRFLDSIVESSVSLDMGDPSVNARYRCGSLVEGKRPNLIPIRFLIDRIARYYGKYDASSIFSFVRENPATNADISSGATFNIIDDGAIPLVDGRWTEAFYSTKAVISNTVSAYSQNMPVIDINGTETILDLGGTYIGIEDITGSQEYVSFYKQSGTGRYLAFAPVDKMSQKMPLRLRGRLLVSSMSSLKIIPFVKVWTSEQARYVPKTDDDGNLTDYIEISSRNIESDTSNYEICFDPAYGGEDITIETPYDVDLWVMQISNIIGTEVEVAEGKIEVLPMRENISYDSPIVPEMDDVELFPNLPDIKVIELLKSIFFIENAYPVIEKDGRIGMMSYNTLFEKIEKGDVYDWSDIVIEGEDKVKFFAGGIGRINRFNMSNYGSEKSEDSPLMYEEATAFFETENEALERENEIYTFPFASAALVTKHGYSAGGTFIFWELDKDGRNIPVIGASPVIGRLKPYRSCNFYKDGSTTRKVTREYLRFKTWQVADHNYENKPIATILKKPYVLDTNIKADALYMSEIDFSKPVYIDKHNSYFAIVSIRMSDRISKAELIRIPVVKGEDKGFEASPEVVIKGTEIKFASLSITNCTYDITATVKGANITRMVISVDKDVIINDKIEEAHISFNLKVGVHTITATAYSDNGKESTSRFNTIVKNR